MAKCGPFRRPLRPRLALPAVLVEPEPIGVSLREVVSDTEVDPIDEVSTSLSSNSSENSSSSDSRFC